MVPIALATVLHPQQLFPFFPTRCSPSVRRVSQITHKPQTPPSLFTFSPIRTSSSSSPNPNPKPLKPSSAAIVITLAASISVLVFSAQRLIHRLRDSAGIKLVYHYRLKERDVEVVDYLLEMERGEDTWDVMKAYLISRTLALDRAKRWCDRTLLKNAAVFDPYNLVLAGYAQVIHALADWYEEIYMAILKCEASEGGPKDMVFKQFKKWAVQRKEDEKEIYAALKYFKREEKEKRFR